MTYCIGVMLDKGMIFASDSRTNAGMDSVAKFCKMTVFERPGNRVIVLLSSGNLAGTQAVISVLTQRCADGGRPAASGTRMCLPVFRPAASSLRACIVAQQSLSTPDARATPEAIESGVVRTCTLDSIEAGSKPD